MKAYFLHIFFYHDFIHKIHDGFSDSVILTCGFDSKPAEVSCIIIKNFNIEETEMGLYVSVNFENEGDKIAADAVNFKIFAVDGTELRYLPGTGGTVSDNGNGSYEAIMSFQKPVSIDGLMFGIRDVFNAVNYGPYTLSNG